MKEERRVLHFTPFIDFAGGNRSMTTLLAAAVQRGPVAACVPLKVALADEIRSAGVETFTSFKAEHLPRWRLRRIPGNFLGLFRQCAHFSLI